MLGFVLANAAGITGAAFGGFWGGALYGAGLALVIGILIAVSDQGERA